MSTTTCTQPTPKRTKLCSQPQEPAEDSSSDAEDRLFEFWHLPRVEPCVQRGEEPREIVADEPPPEPTRDSGDVVVSNVPKNQQEATPKVQEEELVSPRSSHSVDDRRPSTPESIRADPVVDEEGDLEDVFQEPQGGEQSPQAPEPQPQGSPEVLRRSQRQRRPPHRLTYSHPQMVDMLVAVASLLTQFPQLSACIHPSLVEAVRTGVVEEKWKGPFFPRGEACERVNFRSSTSPASTRTVYYV